MLLSTAAIVDAAETLDPRDFDDPVHAAVYEAVIDLYGEGQPTDPEAVARKLGNRAGTADAGGVAHLLQTLADSVPTVANTGYYAEIVAEKAVFRRLRLAAAMIAELAEKQSEDSAGDTEEAIRCARSLVDDAGSDRTGRRVPELEGLLQSTMDELEAIESGGGAGLSVPTGFGELDGITGGLAAGSLTVIGAQPGVGASTLGLCFVRSAALRHGIPAAYLALASTVGPVAQRLLSSEAKVRLEDMRTGRMDDEDWTRLARRTAEISASPIVIARPKDVDVGSLAAEISGLAAHRGVRLVVIDSLHLVTARRDLPYENREREIAEVTRRLKRLALDVGIALVVTSQLSANPGPRKPIPALPSLADLRDSGTIAHIADYVLLIHRPDAWEPNDVRAGEADFILAKNKYGRTATITVAHQLPYARFVDIVRRPIAGS
ncbi:DnaB-like helicase C-terminal domain-containing protein [Amycolatopsis sp. GA6-003]|uniref:DnaB-like helicase C-terminal domain-containing protein n=1 Tax=Amycolatopsis sp. GA6-003 TaxID=2652444 RepID=UPI0039172ABD